MDKSKFFTKQNIGPGHPEFDHSAGNFTQVIIIMKGSETSGTKDQKIAQFVGPLAKTWAAKFWTNCL